MESKKSSKPLQISLPTEIAQEILLKLPVASLLRCKSVCKLWYSLISDTHFIKSHFNSLSNNNNYIYHRIYINSSEELISNGRITETLKYIHVNDVLLYDNTSLNAFDFDYLLKVNNPNPNPNPNTSISILFSCNGLLCVSIDNDTFCICNPSTRTSSKRFSLCRRRYRYHVVHGFGYDESTDDYKFVDLSFRCVSEGIKYDSLTYIYSLKSGKWKKVDEKFPCGLPLDYSGEFSNGCIHWLNDKDVGWLSNLYTIVSFDLAKESFGEFSLPVMYDEDNNNEKILTLGDLGGRLCVLFDHNIYGYQADIWVMKVYGETNSWTKLMSISYPGYLRNRTLLNLPIRMCSMPLCMFSDGKVLLHLSSKLFLYDSENSSFLEIQYNFDWDQSHIIVESLVSPQPTQTLEN